MPTKQQIEKALTSGTPHQRALLLANHIASRKLTKGALLTNDEEEKLHASFRTSYEIAIYRKFAELDELFHLGTMELNQVLLEIKGLFRTFSILWYFSIAVDGYDDVLNFLAFNTSKACGAKKQKDIWQETFNLVTPKIIPFGNLSLKIEENIAKFNVEGFEFDNYEEEHPRENESNEVKKPKKERDLFRGLVRQYITQFNISRASGKVIIETLLWCLKEQRFNVKAYREFFENGRKIVAKNDFRIFNRIFKSKDLITPYEEIEIDKEYEQAILGSFSRFSSSDHKDSI